MSLFFYDKVARLAGATADVLSRPFTAIECWAYNRWRTSDRRARESASEGRRQ